ncbi:efflux RND transporter periplasmic adaptor subunit [Xanthomonas sp. NCPPB 2654]|uniref:efflux RND transporter periplasmic adaptor subunit n=1 Tax=unclassified Xanthomonas TaxID=2643310 RepID=UPI0021E05FA1|nr:MULTISPECIES: efflux RND transporter periplasmic adaptor subunit [unclassified Xanthomonas]MDL5364268.1 efflux RND transporter periplasmic adaptor subunit [Xanthomonas sp. NCPPB 2654]UYC20434.1 efflux RND transporter periplasmic adaptor subunit [Xanthomonas sp. CFBP 8443]
MPVRPFSIVVLCSGALLALAGCGKPAEPEPDADASALAVTLVRAEPRSIQRTVLVSGPVSAYEEMQLGVEISGARVTALNVDVGQAVRRGQVLLELDHRTLDSDLQQARAGLAEADASVALAQANLSRAEKLVKGKYISASQLDELRAARTQAEAQRNTARAARDAAQLRRDFAELRAPADGIVSKRLVQPGQVVASGTELLRLIRDGRLEWRAELPEAELALVAPGASVTLPAAAGSVAGRIRAVSPGVDSQTRTGTIYADLPEPGPLKPGTYVEGRIVVGAGPALMVPAAAVVQRDGHPYVFAVDKQIARRLRVRTGATVDGRIEIVEGLKAGDAVVEQGAGFLGDGDRVRVVANAAAAAAKPAP